MLRQGMYLGAHAMWQGSHRARAPIRRTKYRQPFGTCQPVATLQDVDSAPILARDQSPHGSAP